MSNTRPQAPPVSNKVLGQWNDFLLNTFNKEAEKVLPKDASGQPNWNLLDTNKGWEGTGFTGGEDFSNKTLNKYIQDNGLTGKDDLKSLHVPIIQQFFADIHNAAQNDPAYKTNYWDKRPEGALPGGAFDKSVTGDVNATGWVGTKSRNMYFPFQTGSFTPETSPTLLLPSNMNLSGGVPYKGGFGQTFGTPTTTTPITTTVDSGPINETVTSTTTKTPVKGTYRVVPKGSTEHEQLKLAPTKQEGNKILKKDSKGNWVEYEFEKGGKLYCEDGAEFDVDNEALEVEGDGKLEEISEDNMKVKGPSHAKGGVDLKGGAEVRGGEIITKDGKVYGSLIDDKIDGDPYSGMRYDKGAELRAKEMARLEAHPKSWAKTKLAFLQKQHEAAFARQQAKNGNKQGPHHELEEGGLVVDQVDPPVDPPKKKYFWDKQNSKMYSVDPDKVAKHADTLKNTQEFTDVKPKDYTSDRRYFEKNGVLTETTDQYAYAASQAGAKEFYPVTNTGQKKNTGNATKTFSSTKTPTNTADLDLIKDLLPAGQTDATYTKPVDDLLVGLDITEHKAMTNEAANKTKTSYNKIIEPEGNLYDNPEVQDFLNKNGEEYVPVLLNGARISRDKVNSFVGNKILDELFTQQEGLINYAESEKGENRTIVKENIETSKGFDMSFEEIVAKNGNKSFTMEDGTVVNTKDFTPAQVKEIEAYVKNGYQTYRTLKERSIEFNSLTDAMAKGDKDVIVRKYDPITGAWEGYEKVPLENSPFYQELKTSMDNGVIPLNPKEVTKAFEDINKDLDANDKKYTVIYNNLEQTLKIESDAFKLKFNKEHADFVNTSVPLLQESANGIQHLINTGEISQEEGQKQLDQISAKINDVESGMFTKANQKLQAHLQSVIKLVDDSYALDKKNILENKLYKDLGIKDAEQLNKSVDAWTRIMGGQIEEDLSNQYVKLNQIANEAYQGQSDYKINTVTIPGSGKIATEFGRGILRMFDAYGGAMGYLGDFESQNKWGDLMDAYNAANPQVSKEYVGWQSFTDPDFYIVNMVPSAPMMIAMIGTSVVGGAVSGELLGAGYFGEAATTALTGTRAIQITEGIVSGGINTIFDATNEAGLFFNEQLKNGVPIEKAAENTADVFTNNLNFMALNTGQMMLAFGKIGRLKGWKSFAVKAPFEGGTESFQEVKQGQYSDAWANPYQTFWDRWQSPTGKTEAATGFAMSFAMSAPDLASTASGKEDKWQMNLLYEMMQGPDMGKTYKQLSQQLDLLKARGTFDEALYDRAAAILEFSYSKGIDIPVDLSQPQKLQLLSHLSDIKLLDQKIAKTTDETILKGLNDDKKRLEKEVSEVMNGNAPLYFIGRTPYTKEEFETYVGQPEIFSQIANKETTFTVVNDDKVLGDVTTLIQAYHDSKNETGPSSFEQNGEGDVQTELDKGTSGTEVESDRVVQSPRGEEEEVADTNLTDEEQVLEDTRHDEEQQLIKDYWEENFPDYELSDQDLEYINSKFYIDENGVVRDFYGRETTIAEKVNTFQELKRGTVHEFKDGKARLVRDKDGVTIRDAQGNRVEAQPVKTPMVTVKNYDELNAIWEKNGSKGKGPVIGKKFTYNVPAEEGTVYVSHAKMASYEKELAENPVEEGPMAESDDPLVIAEQSKSPKQVKEAWEEEKQRLKAIESTEDAVGGSDEDMIYEIVKNGISVEDAGIIDLNTEGVSVQGWRMFSKGKGTIDTVIDAINEKHGRNITKDDVAEFIQTHPGGPHEYVKESKRTLLALEDRYKQLTGVSIKATPTLGSVSENVKNTTKAIKEAAPHLKDEEINHYANTIEQSVKGLAKHLGVTEQEARQELTTTYTNKLKEDAKYFQPFEMKMPNGETQQVRRLPEGLDIINGFYSPLEKAVREAKSEKWGDGKQAFGEIAKMAGIKPEELKWTGIEDWLKQQGKVTKADILDYLKNNRVQLVEVVKGSYPKEVEELYKKLEAKNNGREFDDWDVKDQDEWMAKRGEPQETKFSQYQQSGDKSNYREILVTMPFKKVTGEAYHIVRDKYLLPALREIGLPNSENALRRMKVYSDENRMQEFEKDADYPKAKEALLKLQESGKQDIIDKYFEGFEHNSKVEELRNKEFKSSHWDEPNIIGHIRISNRIDSEGNKVLHISEIQSDWAQKGKKEGFESNAYSVKISNKELDGVKLYDILLDGKPIADIDISDLKKWYEKKYREILYPRSVDKKKAEIVADRLNEALTDGKVPEAPFVTSTSSWVKLLLKYAIREGVKDGVTKVTWESGETQNERYDLSKQVDWIKTEDAPQNLVPNTAYVDISTKNGMINLWVDKTTGKITQEKGNGRLGAEGQHLSDVIGKDVAEKILNSKSGTKLEGEGLKVGGKGMIGFYGSPTEGKEGIVGKTAKEVVKELTGKEGKIGETEIITLRGATKFGTETSTQHSIEITPELKAAVEKGMPLFQKEGSEVKGAANVKGKETYLGSKSDVSTLIHEGGHQLYETIKNFADKGNEKAKQIVQDHNNFAASKEGKDFWNRSKEAGEDWAKVEYDATNETFKHELFARAAEKYFIEGKKAGFSDKMVAAFKRFKELLKNIYNGIKNSPEKINLSPELKRLFDAIYGDNQGVPDTGGSTTEDVQVNETQTKTEPISVLPKVGVTLTEKQKKRADNFRKKLKNAPLKLTVKDENGNDVEIDVTTNDFWNGLVEVAAQAIELSGKVADGIKAALAYTKEQGWYKKLTAAQQVEVDEQVRNHIKKNSGVKFIKKKERGFSKTIRKNESEEKSEVRELLNKDPLFYEQLSNEQALKDANDFIDEKGIEAAEEIATDPDVSIQDIVMANVLGIVLIDYYSQQAKKVTGAEKTKLLSKVAKISEITAQRMTLSGRGGNVAIMWKKMTPEAVLFSVQKAIRRYNETPAGQRRKSKFTQAQKGYKSDVEKAVKGVVNSDRLKRIKNSRLVDDTTNEINESKKRSNKAIDDAADRLTKRLLGENPNGMLLGGFFVVSPATVKGFIKTFASALKAGNELKAAIQKAIVYLKSQMGNADIDYDKWAKLLEDEYPTMKEEIEKDLGEPIELRNIPEQVKEALREKNKTIDEIIKSHFTEQAETKQQLIEKLVAKVGVSEKTAQEIATAVEEEFNRITKGGAKKIIEKYFGAIEKRGKVTEEMKADKRDKNSLVNKINETLNMNGLVDPEMLQAFFGARFGLKSLTEAQTADLLKYSEAVQKTEGKFQERATQQLIQKISNIYGASAMDVFWALWYPSMLSGFSTSTLNILNNASNIAMKYIENPLNPSLYLKSLREAIKNKNPKSFLYGNPLFETLMKPVYYFGKNRRANFKLTYSEFLDILKHGMLDDKFADRQFTGGSKAEISVLEDKRITKIPILKYLEFYKYVGRFLQAQDALFFRTNEESEFISSVRRMYVEEGLVGKELYTAVVNELAGNELGAAKAQMEKEAEVYEKITGDKLTTAQKNIRVVEIQRQDRNKQAAEDAVKSAETMVYRGDYRGGIGLAASMLSNITQHPSIIGASARLFVPFTKIVSNVFNYIVDYTPVYGLMRANGLSASALFNKAFVQKVNQGRDIAPTRMGDYQSKAYYDQMGRAWLGLSTFTALAALIISQMDKDDDDPDKIIIVGNHAGLNYNQSKNQQVTDPKGTIRFGKNGKPIPYNLIPALDIPLTILGNWMDLNRWSKGKGANAKLGIAILASKNTFLEKSFVKGVNDFNDVLFDDRYEKAGDKFLELFKRGVGYMTKPLPQNTTLITQIDDIFSKYEYKQTSVEDILKYAAYNGTNTGKPKLDVFGFPIKTYPGENILPIKHWFGLQENDKVWKKLADENLTKKIASFSDLKLLDEDGRAIPVTEEQNYIYKAYAGREWYKILNEALGDDSKMVDFLNENTDPRGKSYTTIGPDEKDKFIELSKEVAGKKAYYQIAKEYGMKYTTKDLDWIKYVSISENPTDEE